MRWLAICILTLWLAICIFSAVEARSLMGDWICEECNVAPFLEERHLNRHMTTRHPTGGKRKLADVNNSSGDERDDAPRGESSSYVPIFNLRTSASGSFSSRVKSQFAGLFNSAPVPWEKYTDVITAAANNPGGYFANRVAFSGNHSEYLFGLTSIENPAITRSGGNNWRDLMKDPDFKPGDVTMDHNDRMAKLYATVSEENRFQKVPIYCDPADADQNRQVYTYVRSVHAAVCRLVDKFDKSFFDLELLVTMKDNVRVYNREIASGNRTQRTKLWVKSTFGDDAVLLPLVFSWDGVSRCVSACLLVLRCLTPRNHQTDVSPFSTSTDSVLCPMSMGILSLHSSRRNEDAALEHIALLPNLTNRDETDARRELNRLPFQHCLDMVLDQVNLAQDQGGWWITFKGDSEPTMVVPVVMAVVLDFKEVQRSALIKSGSTFFPMMNCLVPREELSATNVSGSCESAPRTMEDMWEGEGGGMHREHSIPGEYIPVFSTVRGATEPYQLCLIDWLHAVSKGVGLKLKDSIFDVVRAHLGSRGAKELNNIFADPRNKYIGTKYFRQGITSLANEQAYEV